MKEKCFMKILCVLVLQCVLILVSSCTVDEMGSSLETSQPMGNLARTPIFMNEVPEMYFNVNKNTLKPVEEDNPFVNPPNKYYEDESGRVSYKFDKETGQYRGFFISRVEDDPNAKDVDIDSVEKAADELVSRFINVSDYERTYDFKEELSTHRFRYRKFIAGYGTMDQGYVWITAKGSVKNVSSDNTGKFDNIRIPEIDEKALDEQFKLELIEQFKKERNVTIISDNIEIHDRIMDVEGKQLYMIYTFLYTYMKDDRPSHLYEEMRIKIG